MIGISYHCSSCFFFSSSRQSSCLLLLVSRQTTQSTSHWRTLALCRRRVHCACATLCVTSASASLPVSSQHWAPVSSCSSPSAVSFRSSRLSSSSLSPSPSSSPSSLSPPCSPSSDQSQNAAAFEWKTCYACIEILQALLALYI